MLVDVNSDISNMLSLFDVAMLVLCDHSQWLLQIEGNFEQKRLEIEKEKYLLSYFQVK